MTSEIDQDNFFLQRRARRPAAVLVAALVAALPAVSARASEASLKVDYGITVAGFPVGKAHLKFALDGDGYQVTGSGRTSGIVKLFSDGHGNVTASGKLAGARPVPSSFAYDMVDEDGRETMKIVFQGDRVDTVDLEPPEDPEKSKRRVPLEQSHKVGVLDPLSALFIPAVEANVCDRTLPIFDGEQRFDLVLAPKRVDRFDGGKSNYKGRVAVCSIAYRPIAGHRTDKADVEYMQRNKGMEIWLAPIGDTGVMAPLSIRLKTKVGWLAVEARRFQSN